METDNNEVRPLEEFGFVFEHSSIRFGVRIYDNIQDFSVHITDDHNSTFNTWDENNRLHIK